ncbi:MAG: PIN domain-containing protein [Nitrospirae bacterium]|nr:PIN domain-containing protein [Nitrospirota bacterium]
MLLVDTSVWIELFRRPSRIAPEAFPLDDVTCLPIVQEVLQGFRDEHAFRIAREAMFALPIVQSPMERPVFEDAVQLYRTARRRGFTVRSSVDCLIAACAIRHGLTVLHTDRDYTSLSRISPLRTQALPLR